MESLARQELAGLDGTNESLKRRLVLEERLSKIQDEKKKAGLVKENPLVGLDGKQESGADMVKDEIAADELRVRLANKRFADETRAQIAKKAFAKEELDHLANVADRVEVARVAMGAFGTATEDAMAALVSGSGGAGEAFKRAILNALGAVAAQKGAYYGAEALAALGEGFLTGDPSRFTAAAELSAASLGFYALAGAAGGLGAGSGSGGGSGGGNSASYQSSASQSQGPLVVQFTGSRIIDASNPQSQDEFVAMIQKLGVNRQIIFTGGG
jgi:hypothetical protein